MYCCIALVYSTPNLILYFCSSFVAFSLSDLPRAMARFSHRVLRVRHVECYVMEVCTSSELAWAKGVRARWSNTRGNQPPWDSLFLNFIRKFSGTARSDRKTAPIFWIAWNCMIWQLQCFLSNLIREHLHLILSKVRCQYIFLCSADHRMAQFCEWHLFTAPGPLMSVSQYEANPTTNSRIVTTMTPRREEESGLMS